MSETYMHFLLISSQRENRCLEVLKALSGFIAIAIENSFLIEELEASFEGAIRTLAATVDARHPLTADTHNG